MHLTSRDILGSHIVVDLLSFHPTQISFGFEVRSRSSISKWKTVSQEMDCVEVFTFRQFTRGLHFCVLSNPPNPTYSHACLIIDQIIRRSEDRENTSTDTLDSHMIFDFLSVSSHSSDFRGCCRSQQHHQMDGRQPRMGCLEVLNTFWQIHPRPAFLDAFVIT